MKKILFLVLILKISSIYSEFVEIGPLEEQDNALAICRHACSKKKLTWTDKWDCLYSPELKQHTCLCECK